MSNRLQQINETLKHEISLILAELCEEEWGIITVTDVQINPDLKSARVWIDAEKSVINEITTHSREITKLLRPRITFKHIPSLKFLKDDESISRVEEILEKIK